MSENVSIYNIVVELDLDGCMFYKLFKFPWIPRSGDCLVLNGCPGMPVVDDVVYYENVPGVFSVFMNTVIFEGYEKKALTQHGWRCGPDGFLVVAHELGLCN